MSGVLTRYVTVELLKTILVTTGVLVTVIAFGATVKPLVRNLLGGFDIARYVALACIPMLQYALPFASGFGATLVMHRFASDNEVIAMSASGLGYGRIFRPIFLLATVLLLVMVVLVNFVVPAFFTRMESMLAHDVTRLLASAVERGEAFDLGDTRIYADEVRIVESPEDTDAIRRLLLGGVAAVQVSGRGRLETEFTAESATLDLYRVDGRSILKLALGDATVYRADEDTFVRMPAAEPRAIDLGRRLEPNPKMMMLPRMLELRADPLSYWRIDERIDELGAERSRERLRRDVLDRLARDGSIRLLDAGRDRTWTIAGELDPADPSTLAGPTLRLDDRDGVAEAVRIEWAVVDRDGLPVIDLDIEPVIPDDPDAEPMPREARSLALDGFAVEPEASVDREEILAWAGAGSDTFTSETVAATVRTRLDRIEDLARELRWDIDARIQQRLAQSVTGPLLLILGSILAIMLRHATPLLVYIVAFVPAIADILLISGGEQSLRDGPGLVGYGLVWSGNLLLVVLCLLAWTRLRRN